ncbi:hypothetical protein GCM10027321_27330 [Massilia terrae]|uniref:Uncharacterized protein n=1 Tax=Massilia terrae TaxID=1811224 RepID=A0ABT2CZ29_9BURK|nr:hypothetical protein [Massilia terrae]MCS0659119.1 hypothetical protein [Massilia terrae]
MIKRIFSAGTVLLALVLAGCGGGGDGVAPTTKTAADVVINDPVIDSAAFVKLAVGMSSCADRKNRLWVIDGKQVFWDRAGYGCPDMNWSQKLYGATPDALQCSSEDSIAGPQTRCADDSKRALFDIVSKNADAANLGLDSSHKVVPIMIPEPMQTALPFMSIAKFGNNGVKARQNVVIKDADAYAKLWNSVVVGMTGAPPAPAVDFSRQMVVGVFAGANALSCGSMLGVSKVSLRDGNIVVDYEIRKPSGPIVCMAIVDGAPMELVTIDRSDAPVQFVRHDVELMMALAVDDSADSGIHTAREIIINDQSSFEQLWTDHAGKDKPMPSIDFSKKMVIGLFAGWVSYCDGLVLDSITNDGKQITVNYFRTVPPAGTACIAMVRSPAILVAIDRTLLPIYFHKDTITR